MRVEILFHGELNDLLAPSDRGLPQEARVAPGTSVKDLVESLGVPHTEIDVIVVDGESVDFGHPLADGEQVDVYPTATADDRSRVVRLRPGVAQPVRFVLDVHLGRLARLLRLLGFDSVWRNEASDAELARISVDEDRVLLTRDRGLLKRRVVTSGYLVRAMDRAAQLHEVLQRFGLRAVEPFGRCLECNARLERVEKEGIESQLPPRTRRDYDEFQRCQGCGRIYWRGSHYDRLRTLVDEICRREGLRILTGADRRSDNA